MAQSILVVDDEPIIVKGLKFSLEQDGYVVEAAYDGEEALTMFRANQYDLIILDLMLPKMDGTEVCQTIREHSDIPIIMLTAKGDDMDKIMGFEYGADDYMTKPFNILELKARIKSVLHRAGNRAGTARIIKSGELSIDLEQRRVEIAGREIRLTVKEYELLRLLATNKGKIYNRQQLLDAVWRADTSGDLRTMDVYIRRLREKIEEDPGQPEYILTKWGVGYFFTDR